MSKWSLVALVEAVERGVAPGVVVGGADSVPVVRPGVAVVVVK